MQLDQKERNYEAITDKNPMSRLVCMDGSYLQGVFRVWRVVICMYVSGLLVRHSLWP